VSREASWVIHQDVLVALMRSQGVSPANLARAAACSPSLVRHAVHATRSTFSASSVSALAAVLGVEAHILGHEVPRVWTLGGSPDRSFRAVMGAHA